MDAKYEVLVGNIGYVLRTDDFEQAIKTYKEYVAQSESNYGRAGGENVVLFEHEEPIKEHFGTLNRDEDEFAKGGEIAEIEKAKQTLIRKAKSKGIYENFGQKEVRQLKDKYGYTSAISEFNNWASNFDLSQMGEGGGISTKKLNWRLGLGHPKYYYGFNNGIIYATEENNITNNLQIKDIELVFPIKAKNFIGEKHRTEFISEMVNIFPELTNLEIVEAIHYGGSMETGGGVAHVMSKKDRSRLDELQKKEDIHDLNKSENEEYERLVVEYRKTKEYKDNQEHADGGSMATGGGVADRMYNFLVDDLAKLEKAIEENDKEEIDRFFSYWGTHLKSLAPKKGSDRMYNFLKEDLIKLEKATEENDKEEIDRFFSYWGTHLKSLKYAYGGSMATGGGVGEVREKQYYINIYNKKIKDAVQDSIKKTGKPPEDSWEWIENEGVDGVGFTSEDVVGYYLGEYEENALTAWLENLRHASVKHDTDEDVTRILKKLNEQHSTGGSMATGGGVGKKDFSGNYFSTNDFVGSHGLQKQAEELFGKGWKAEDDVSQIEKLIKSVGGKYVVIVTGDKDEWYEYREKYDLAHPTNDHNYDIFVIPKNEFSFGGSMATGGGVKDNTGLNIQDEKLIGTRTIFKAFVSSDKKQEAKQKINILFKDHIIKMNDYDDKLRGEVETEFEIIPNYQGTLSLKATNDNIKNLQSLGIVRSFTISKRQYSYGGSMKKGGIIESIGEFLTKKISLKDFFN